MLYGVLVLVVIFVTFDHEKSSRAEETNIKK